VDEDNAEAEGGLDGGDFDGFVVEFDCAGIGEVHAGEDAHEGGFASAVFADDSEDSLGLRENEMSLRAWTPGKDLERLVTSNKGMGCRDNDQ